jgi:probable F420-dependent oxidoreductase
MSERPFRFGAVFGSPYTVSNLAECARRLEGEGFSTLLFADHYAPNPVACGPALVAAANATTTLRLGSYVYNNDFRHPALLAKEAATIDVLSGGRLEFGLGAGYYKQEYDAVGIPFDPPPLRARRFEEAIDIITRLFNGETVDFAGQHYRLSEYNAVLAPLQQPIPLMIAGGGQRMLRLAARTANIVGIVPQSLPGGWVAASGFTPAALDSRVALLESAISDAGRTDGGPERNMLLFGIASSVDGISEGGRALRFMTPEVLATSPYVLLGDDAAMVEALHERRERWGFTYVVCWADELDKFIPVVRRLAGSA